MKNFSRMLETLLLFSLLTSCSSIGDGGFLSGKPCPPPCFYNITPGITTKNEAEDILKQNEFSCTFFDYTSSSGGQGFMCSWGEVGLEGNVVDSVFFRPASKIEIQQVIDKYGEPDFVRTGIVSLPDDKVRVGMILGFKEIRAWVWLEEQSTIKYTVREHSLVRYVAYSVNVEPGPNDMLWKGYGEYDWTFP